MTAQIVVMKPGNIIKGCLIGLCVGLTAWAVGAAPQPAAGGMAKGPSARNFAAPKPPAIVNDWSKDEFQFKFTLSNPDASGSKASNESTVYLYIPVETRRVRALLLLQQNVAEQMIAVHPAIRKVCNVNDIAIAWCRPPFDATFELSTAAATHKMLQEEFGRFGRQAGYPELGETPLITFGHSSTCAYCQNAAEARPDRVLAVLVTHGWNGVDSFRAYKGPVLLFIGHYWEQRQQGRSVGANKNMASLAKVRRKLDVGWMPISVVEEYGSGHFDYSDQVVEILAMFIDKAVKTRLGKDGKLKDIDPNSGYIAAIPSSPAGPIPVKPYASGTDREKAGSVWFFDKELAEAAVKVISGNGPWQRTCQIIGYNHPDGTPAPFGRSGLVNPVPYRIVPGTNEIQLFPVLLDAFPADFKQDGEPIGISSDPTIMMEYVCGPYLYLDKDAKYCVKINRGGTSGYVVARNLGDEHMRPTVQPTYIVLGRGGQNGGGSAPTFNPGGQTPGAVIPIKNTSTVNEYAGYYIDHGPARILQDKLEILPLPANTQGSLEVEMVAYTLGQDVSGFSSVRFNVTK